MGELMVVGRLRKAALVVAIALIGGAASSVAAAAVEDGDVSDWSGIAYDKITLEQLATIEHASVVEDGERITVEFDVQGRSFVIVAMKSKRVAVEGAATAYETAPEANGRGFNLVVDGGKFVAGVAFASNVAPQHFGFDDRLAFTIGSQQDSKAEARGSGQIAAISDAVAHLKQGRSTGLSPIVGGNAALAPNAWGSAHVLVDNTSIPFILAGGFSEGWVDITPSGPKTHIVSNLRYSISANWGSDGVSLWYNGQTNSRAYRSPTWPSGGLQYVSGSWSMNTDYASLLAENTYSLLVKYIPIMYTRYDNASV
ncbi:hypothetical protein LGT39_14215 [Demequina sp. TTPB684]|uniref:hypothetical protein n=1 Tax=unclassified Demequina TaxID=2620311 RepID=UPI001CF57C34|nr:MULTISPECIES: hypothetical protein [unclassified Demequina]MCB2414002.1 hypothetical protein [Demequina sp. TTPB684]UPU89117.1 hypothetical protein LGT36_004115 [Demequina sp. TMPB413]